jgi:hypothetical protein
MCSPYPGDPETVMLNLFQHLLDDLLRLSRRSRNKFGMTGYVFPEAVTKAATKAVVLNLLQHLLDDVLPLSRRSRNKFGMTGCV